MTTESNTSEQRDSVQIDESDDFDFEVGDTIVVRVRENGDTGTIEGKFKGVAEGFLPGVMGTSDTALISPPWDDIGNVQLTPFEAEFEVIGDNEEIHF